MKRMWKAALSLMLLLVTTGISFDMISFSNSIAAILEDQIRPRSLIDHLCKAICAGDYFLVEYIVKEKNCDVNKRDHSGDLPLYAAILLSNHADKIEVAIKIVDLLLQYGADPHLEHFKGISVIELFEMADRSCFYEVFAKHGYFWVERYRSFMYDDAMKQKDMMGHESLVDNLCEAIRNGDYDRVESFVKENCNVNEMGQKGDLPLYEAVLLSNYADKIEVAVKIVDLLLKHGADPRMENGRGISVLDLSWLADRSYFNQVFAKYGYPEFAEYGYSNFVNEIELNKRMASKPLVDCACEAIRKGDLGLLKYIIKVTCFNLNRYNLNRRLPLEEVFLFSKDTKKTEIALEMLDLLLQHGANPFMTNERGISVLKLFKIEDKEGFNEIFAKYGFDIS